MPHRTSCYRGLFAFTVFLAAAGLTRPCAAQTVGGQARAVQSTVSGLFGPTTTMLADTGTLDGGTDARQASALADSVPSLLSAETLHATTIGSPTGADSEASLAGLTMTVGGNSIGADFVMSRVQAVQGAVGTGSTTVSGLSVNGVPIAVDESPNQVIAIPGGQIVVNEQQISQSSTAVNALRVTVFGVADVIVASAMAAVQ